MTDSTQTWAIVLFPRFAPEQRPAIDRLRDAYDPLAARIEPHITLVFPFASALTAAEMVAHTRQCISGFAPFAVEVRGVTGQQDEWLFLNVKRGNDAIIALHDRLYSGPLAVHADSRYTYTPHVTVGHLAPEEAFVAALRHAALLTETFQAMIETVTAYRVASDGARDERYAVALDAAL